jgi:hypothetical protein
MTRPTAEQIRAEPAGRRLDALLASINETAPADKPGQ